MSPKTQLPDKSTLIAMATIINIKDQLKKGTMSIYAYQVGETDTDIPEFEGLFYDDTHEIKELSDSCRTAYPLIDKTTRKNGMSVPETSYGYCELLKTTLPPYLEYAPFKIDAAYIIHNDNPSDDQNYVRIQFTTDRDKYGHTDAFVVGVKANGPIDIL